MIKIENLVKCYPKFDLRIDDLELTENNVYALVGANGSGKTTFLSCLTNQLKFTGDIYYDNLSLTENRELILRQIGYVGDSLYFIQNIAVTEYYSFIKSFYPTWDDDLFKELLKRLQADLYLHTKIKHLSKGNTLKVALIACLSCKCKYLLLAEPTAGLDIAMRQELYQVINDYRKPDTTVIFSTHMVEDIDDMASHILLINDGRLILNGTIDALLEEASLSGVRELILRYLS